MTHGRTTEIVVKDGRLYHLGVAVGELAPNLFLVGDPERTRRVAERFDTVSHEICHREYVTLSGFCRGVPMSVIGTGIGCDNVEIALVEACAVLRFDLATLRRKAAPPPVNVIRIGTSGGVQAEISTGVLAISEYALGLDSTGLFYDHPEPDARAAAIEAEAQRLLAEAAVGRFKDRIPPYASKASSRVFRALFEQAQAAGVPFATGITAATPGFYGPSGRFIEGLSNSVPGLKGVLARIAVDGRRVINVEMESSLLFHLAAALGLHAGTVCPILSNPARHHAIGDYGRFIEQAVDIAVEAMIELAQRSD